MNERLKERIAEEWAMLDPVDPLRRLLSDVIDVLAQTSTECEKQPAQKPYEISTEELIYMAGVHDGKVLEREACAVLAQQTICDTHIPTGINIYGTRAAKAIRARGNT